MSWATVAKIAMDCLWGFKDCWRFIKSVNQTIIKFEFSECKWYAQIPSDIFFIILIPFVAFGTAIGRCLKRKIK